MPSARYQHEAHEANGSTPLCNERVLTGFHKHCFIVLLFPLFKIKKVYIIIKAQFLREEKPPIARILRGKV